MEKVNSLLKEIKDNLSQTSASQKDEIRVMRAMLNDKEYSVSVYGKEGKVGTMCPSEEARTMAASIISSTAKIPAAEAAKLADDHEFSKAESVSMINISKEFVNTFLQTGRKLPLGGREKSNVAIAAKEIKETQRSYPKKVGVNADGTPRCDMKSTTVPAHNGIRVYSPCPEWVEK